MSFDELKLSEADIEIIDGDRGVNYPKQNEFYDIGYCLFLNAKNVTKDGFDFNEKSFISREKDNLLRKGKLVRNDIVLTTRGTVGNVAFYNNRVPFNNIRINSGMVILRAKQSEYLPEFVYWMFRSNYIQDQINALKTGSAQPQLPITIMRTIKVLKPKLCEQKVIAATLSALDDMIELNNQINKTLEEMAQAIFKSWFVDFEPFRDGEFEESELGLIPKGWRVGAIDDVLSEIETGNRPKGGVAGVESGIPSIGAENVLGLGKYDYSKEKYVSEEFYNSMKKGKLKDWDVLLYKDGAQLGRKTMFALGFPHKKCCVNSHVFILRSNSRMNQCYLYFWLDQDYMTQKIIGLNANSAQPGINQPAVKGLPILIPPIDVLERFDDLVVPIIKNLFSNCLENNILVSIRDTLLPKLMSGEIRVPVEEVV